MAMFKKRISEESSASESQWSSEQIQASASVTNLGEFGGKQQGSFDDDIVTTSIHWVSFEDLPDKDKDATVGDTQLKWPSWKKGAAKFSKALSSSPTLRNKPEPELTGRISSICRPLSAYGSVRNMDRGIVTATVGYQTDDSSVEEAEHINSAYITFNNDSIDSGHEGNFDEDSIEEYNEQRDESLSSNPLNRSNSSEGEHCNMTHEVECVAGQRETWQDNDHQFTAKSASQCCSTEVNDSKCEDGRRPCHIQQVPEKTKVVGFPDQQAGLAAGIGDCYKDEGNEEALLLTAPSNSSRQGNDADEQLQAECNDIVHHGGSNNVKPGRVDADVRRIDTGAAVSKSSVASPSTNCVWNETDEKITTTAARFSDHKTTKNVANPSCNAFTEVQQNNSCSNEGMNSYESGEGRSREDNYAPFAQDASTREAKKEDAPARSSPRDGVDQQPSRCPAERRNSEDEGDLASGHFSQEGAANADLEDRHSRITQQTCSMSDGKRIHQEATASLEKIPSADQPMHPMRKTAEESEYCQCTSDGTDHEVQAPQPGDSSDERQIEDNVNIVSMQRCMESLQNDETSDRRLSSTTGDDSCPNVEREDAALQHHTQEGINDNRSRDPSEDLDTNRQEQTFPSQMAFGSPPRLLSFGNPHKRPNSPRRRGSPRIDQIADKLLKNAVVLVERLPRSITDKASQKMKDKCESPRADSMFTGDPNQVDNVPTSRVGVVPPNISNELSVAGCSPKERREPCAPPKKRNMKKLLPKPSEPQRYTDGMYPYVPNSAAIPFYPSAHGPVAQQHIGQQSAMPPPPPNGLQYQFAPHGAQYPLGSSQQYHDNGAHQRFCAPYSGIRPRYLPPASAAAGFRNTTYPDTLQSQSNQSLQQPNPSLVVRIREVGPESMLATQNRAILDGQQMTADNVTPIYHPQQGAMEGSTAMHQQRPRLLYHANEGGSLQESRQGAMSSQSPLAADSRKPPSLIDAVIEEMYDRDEPAIAQQTSAWRMSTSANRTERPVIPEVFVSPPARRLKENREVKSAMNLVDKMIEDAYFSSKSVKDADAPPAKKVRPFGHSRYSPPLTVSMSDGGPASVHSTPPAHPKDFMSALVARVVDEEYAKDDVAAVPKRHHHDRQLQDNGTPYGDQPNLPGPMAKPQEIPTSNQKQEHQISLTNVRSEQAYNSPSSPVEADVLSNANDTPLQDGQGHEVESNTEVITSDNQDTPTRQVAGTPKPRNADSEVPSESPKSKNLDATSISSLETDLNGILFERPADENSTSENNGHRCATGRAEPDSKPLIPSHEHPDGKECATIFHHVANNGLVTEEEEKETLGNNEKENTSSSGGENIIGFSPRKAGGRDCSSNENSPFKKESSTSQDLPPNSTTLVDSETADRLSNLCIVELAEASDLVVDEETASNDRDDANEDVGRRRLEEGEGDDVATAATTTPNEQTGSGEVKGENNTSSALTDERDKSGPKRAGRPKGRKRGVEGRQKKSMTRIRDKADSSATSEARIAHEFPRHNWLMKHLMAEQQLVTNQKDPRKSPIVCEKSQADPNEEECKEEEEEKTPGEVEGTTIVKDKSKRKPGTLSRDSSMESCTSLDTLSSTEKLEGENDNVFPGPVSPSTTEKKSIDKQVSQPESHSPKTSITAEDSATVDDTRGSGDKGLPTTESATVNESGSTDSRAEAPQTSARQSQEEPLNLSLKAARFVDFYNSIGSKNITKAPAEGKDGAARASATAEQVPDETGSPADGGDSTKSPVVPPITLDTGLKKEDLSVSPKDERASTEQSSPKPAAGESGSYTPITVTVHTTVPKANATPPQALDPAQSSSETKPPQVPAMGNAQDRPVSRNNTSMFSFEDVPKEQRTPRQDGHHQGPAPKRPASPTVRCPPRKRSTVDSGVVCLSPYSPVSPSDKTTSPASVATKLHEETVTKRRAKTASLPETATTTAPHQFAVPSQQAVLPSKKSQALRSSSAQERPSVISAVPVTPPLPPRPSAPPPPPTHEAPYRGDQTVTGALLARLEVMTKNKVNIERELVNQELLLTELRKRALEDKSGLLRKQSQEKEALLFHMRMTYNKLCEDIDYLMRSGPPKFADVQKSLHSTAPNSTAPNSIGQSSQGIPIHRAQSDGAITLQAGGKITGEAGNRWRETTSNERRSSEGENSSDVQIIGQKGPTMSNSLQDFRHMNPHVNPPPYLDPRYVTDARQALMYGNTATGPQQYPAVSTVAQSHISPRSVAPPRFSPYAQAQNDLAAATAAERRRQAHMDVKRAKQILNEHKSFVEKYSRPGEAGNPHNIATGNEAPLNAPVNTAIPQAPVQGGVPTSTIHPYPHGVPIHPAVTMTQVIPILPGDPSFVPRSTAIAHMVAPDQRPLPAMTHQGMHPFYYISPGMPVPAGYQQQPIPGQSPRVLNPVTQQLLSPPAGQQTPTSTTPNQLNNLRGAHHRSPNATSIVSVNSKDPLPAAQHHPVLLPGKPSPGQMCHHHQLQQYGWPGQLPTNSAEMNAAYFAAHAAQHAAKVQVQSRAEAAMKRGSSVKDHLQRPNVVALPEMQQAAYLSKHFKAFSVTAPENSIIHPSKIHPAHLQQARAEPKDLLTRVGQTTAREAAYLQDVQVYHTNNQPASVFRGGNPMMRGPSVVENGQGSPGTMGGPPRRDAGSGIVSIADDEYHSCVVCNKEATFLCSGCRKAWYCSPSCQVQAWEKHSEDCL